MTRPIPGDRAKILDRNWRYHNAASHADSVPFRARQWQRALNAKQQRKQDKAA